MSELKAFLQPTVEGITKKIVVSERFKDEEGNPVPFTIRAISQTENEKLSNMSMKKISVKGKPVDRLDNVLYTKRLVHACVQEPDFSAHELCKYYGTEDPLEVPAKMLSVGEYSRLTEEILELNGMIDPTEKFEEAKNF